eukprot:GHVN01090417.1.p1 GENE.GHVN01090417.1~~GHVN01090417.1.p1  ORF type:complete len:1223 (+),score=290.31 GHVN01090417.1:164-3832(+)
MAKTVVRGNRKARPKRAAKINSSTDPPHSPHSAQSQVSTSENAQSQSIWTPLRRSARLQKAENAATQPQPEISEVNLTQQTPMKSTRVKPNLKRTQETPPTALRRGKRRAEADPTKPRLNTADSTSILTPPMDASTKSVRKTASKRVKAMTEAKRTALSDVANLADLDNFDLSPQGDEVSNAMAGLRTTIARFASPGETSVAGDAPQAAPTDAPHSNASHSMLNSCDSLTSHHSEGEGEGGPRPPEKLTPRRMKKGRPKKEARAAVRRESAQVPSDELMLTKEKEEGDETDEEPVRGRGRRRRTKPSDSEWGETGEGAATSHSPPLPGNLTSGEVHSREVCDAGDDEVGKSVTMNGSDAVIGSGGDDESHKNCLSPQPPDKPSTGIHPPQDNHSSPHNEDQDTDDFGHIAISDLPPTSSPTSATPRNSSPVRSFKESTPKSHPHSRVYPDSPVYQKRHSYINGHEPLTPTGAAITHTAHIGIGTPISRSPGRSPGSLFKRSSLEQLGASPPPRGGGVGSPGRKFIDLMDTSPRLLSEDCVGRRLSGVMGEGDELFASLSGSDYLTCDAMAKLDHFPFGRFSMEKTESGEAQHVSSNLRLPDELRDLVRIYDALEISLKQRRSRMMPHSNLWNHSDGSESLRHHCERVAHTRCTLTHLRRIAWLAPDLIELRWRKPPACRSSLSTTGMMSNDTYLQDIDIEVHTLNEAGQSVLHEISSSILQARSRVFAYRCLYWVKNRHDEFLMTENPPIKPLSLLELSVWHPCFKLDHDCLPVPLKPLPPKPNGAERKGATGGELDAASILRSATLGGLGVQGLRSSEVQFSTPGHLGRVDEPKVQPTLSLYHTPSRVPRIGRSIDREPVAMGFTPIRSSKQSSGAQTYVDAHPNRTPSSRISASPAFDRSRTPVESRTPIKGSYTPAHSPSVRGTPVRSASPGWGLVGSGTPCSVNGATPGGCVREKTPLGLRMAYGRSVGVGGGGTPFRSRLSSQSPGPVSTMASTGTPGGGSGRKGGDPFYGGDKMMMTPQHAEIWDRMKERERVKNLETMLKRDVDDLDREVGFYSDCITCVERLVEIFHRTERAPFMQLRALSARLGRMMDCCTHDAERGEKILTTLVELCPEFVSLSDSKADPGVKVFNYDRRADIVAAKATVRKRQQEAEERALAKKRDLIRKCTDGGTGTPSTTTAVGARGVERTPDANIADDTEMKVGAVLAKFPVDSTGGA